MEALKALKIFDPKAALQKAEHFCAYQERSQQEVRNKLYEWGILPVIVENTITTLIENNFLNEERFAKAYVQGKFKQKSWGKIKIKQGLKLKRVSDVLIKKALKSIDEDDYIATLTQVIAKKTRTLVEKDSFKLSYKLRQYALSRGFETDLIMDVLNSSDL